MTVSYQDIFSTNHTIWTAGRISIVFVRYFRENYTHGGRPVFLKNMTFGTVPWERKQRKEAKECSVAGVKLAVLSCTSKSCDKIVSCFSCRKLLVLTNLIVILFKLEIYDLRIICNCRRFLKVKFPIACFDVPVFVTVFDRVSCQHPAFFWFRFSWREITQATLIRFFS